MQWMKDNELPPWAYVMGALLLAIGGWIGILTKYRLVSLLLICMGSWLIRWWYEAPANHLRFQKVSERQFRFYRGAILTSSWMMLILTVAAVCVYVFHVLS